MNLLNKKKKGSSLALVLMVLFVLSILGTAVLSLTVMNYKKRISENNIKYNQYASETGLDEAKEIISKYTEKAIEAGNDAVDRYMELINSTIEEERNLVEESKKRIQDALNNGETPEELYVSEYVDEYGNLREEKRQEIEAEKLVQFKNGYENYFTDNGHNNLDNLLADLQNNENYSMFNDESGINLVNNDEYFINADDNDFTNDELNIILQSNYKKNKILKTIQVNFTIKVPEYNKTNVLPKEYYRVYRNPVWAKAISADGDMLIKDGSVTVANGDVYIKGNNNGGVILSDNASKLTMDNGNLVSSENLLVPNGINTRPNITCSNDVYVKNILVEKESKGANIDIGNYGSKKGAAYILDDLEMNANKTNITIGGGLYGLSDGSEYPEPNHSSAIVINTNDIGSGSSLKIGKELYLLGTAYISNLGYYGNPFRYQTGESISIKGKYKAYSQPIGAPYDNVLFEYFNPLTLASEKQDNGSGNVTASVKYYVQEDGNDYSNKTYIKVSLTENGLTQYQDAVMYSIEGVKDSNGVEKTAFLGEPIEEDGLVEGNSYINIKLLDIDGNSINLDSNDDSDNDGYIDNIELVDRQLSAKEKSEYFKSYYDENSEKVSGIEIDGATASDDKDYHAGAIYSGDNNEPIITQNIPLGYEESIREKRAELKNQLFYMGGYKNIDNPDDKKFKTLTPKVYVGKEINFDDSSFSYPSSSTNDSEFINLNSNMLDVNSNKDTIILNNDDNKDIAIVGNNGDTNKIPADAIRINADTFNGIIITKGNVYFDGKVDYKGTIISEKNIEFLDSKNVKITYDKDYVERIVRNNYEIFDGIFNQFLPSDYIKVEKYSHEADSNNTPTVEVKNWVIMK